MKDMIVEIMNMEILGLKIDMFQDGYYESSGNISDSIFFTHVKNENDFKKIHHSILSYPTSEVSSIKIYILNNGKIKSEFHTSCKYIDMIDSYMRDRLSRAILISDEVSIKTDDILYAGI